MNCSVFLIPSFWIRLPRWLSGKRTHLQCRRCGFNPWVWKIPWRRRWQPTPVFLPGKSHGQRSLREGLQPLGSKRAGLDLGTHKCFWISEEKYDPWNKCINLKSRNQTAYPSAPPRSNRSSTHSHKRSNGTEERSLSTLGPLCH